MSRSGYRHRVERWDFLIPVVVLGVVMLFLWNLYS